VNRPYNDGTYGPAVGWRDNRIWHWTGNVHGTVRRSRGSKNRHRMRRGLSDLRRLRLRGPLSALEHHPTHPSRPRQAGKNLAGFASSVRDRETTSAEYDVLHTMENSFVLGVERRRPQQW